MNQKLRATQLQSSLVEEQEEKQRLRREVEALEHKCRSKGHELAVLKRRKEEMAAAFERDVSQGPSAASVPHPYEQQLLSPVW